MNPGASRKRLTGLAHSQPPMSGGLKGPTLLWWSINTKTQLKPSSLQMWVATLTVAYGWVNLWFGVTCSRFIPYRLPRWSPLFKKQTVSLTKSSLPWVYRVEPTPGADCSSRLLQARLQVQLFCSWFVQLGGWWCVEAERLLISPVPSVCAASTSKGTHNFSPCKVNLGVLQLKKGALPFELIRGWVNVHSVAFKVGLPWLTRSLNCHSGFAAQGTFLGITQGGRLS